MRTLLFLCALSLAGCAPSRPQTPADRAKAAADRAAAAARAEKDKQAAEQGRPAEPDVSTATGFKFAGTDSLNKPCSTGAREFSSRRLLCIHLQDDAGNGHCAYDKRLDKFQRECAPEFTWNESLSCHFALLDPDAPVAPNGEYDVKYLKQAGDLCAGRAPGGVDLPGSTATGVSLVDDIFYDVENVFVPESTPGRVRSHFRMSIYRKDATGKHLPLADEFLFTSGFRAVSGKLSGAPYKYVFRCGNTWACTAR